MQQFVVELYTSKLMIELHKFYDIGYYISLMRNQESDRNVVFELIGYIIILSKYSLTKVNSN
jgi:hypothetical protein